MSAARTLPSLDVILRTVACIHSRFAEHDELAKMANEWGQKFVEDVKVAETELAKLNSIREQQRTALIKHQERYDKELADLAEKEVCWRIPTFFLHSALRFAASALASSHCCFIKSTRSVCASVHVLVDAPFVVLAYVFPCRRQKTNELVTQRTLHELRKNVDRLQPHKFNACWEKCSRSCLPPLPLQKMLKRARKRGRERRRRSEGSFSLQVPVLKL